MKRSVLASLLVLAFARPALAQSEDDRARAEKLNEEGKRQIALVDFDGAAGSFRAAIQIQPDPRYYYNLCYTLHRAGKLREAHASCEMAAADKKDPRLAAKAKERLTMID